MLTGRKVAQNDVARSPAGVLKVVRSRWPELREPIRPRREEPRSHGSWPERATKSSRWASRRPPAAICDPFETGDQGVIKERSRSGLERKTLTLVFHLTPSPAPVSLKCRRTLHAHASLALHLHTADRTDGSVRVWALKLLASHGPRCSCSERRDRSHATCMLTLRGVRS